MNCPTCDGFRTIPCGEQRIPASWYSPAEYTERERTCPECHGAGVVSDDEDDATTTHVVGAA